MGQRLYFCTGNLGSRFALAINDFLAMVLFLRRDGSLSPRSIF
jgi:hypothetical protein